ncbi:MAG: arginine N-succinyltransferase [Desulfuromusa sp.]|nr:arginine N-succinyltransferase [Desulfuromusa sp.]
MVDQTKKKGFSGMQVFGIVVLVMVLTIVGTIFAAKTWFFPRPFTPVVLSQKEETRLEEKLQQFEMLDSSPVTTSIQKNADKKSSGGSLKPEAYSEEGASRAISLSEREVNALLAKNTDLADKLVIDLSDDLVSARLLIPVDPDFPMFGGKTLRVKAGVELAYREARPVVKIRGVSIMGVPVPAAWMGGHKNIDLIEQFGADEGFWKTFSDGVDSITVQEGQLHIQLKE